LSRLPTTGKKQKTPKKSDKRLRLPQTPKQKQMLKRQRTKSQKHKE